MQAIDLIRLCAREYNDVAYSRIAKSGSSSANWLDWLNDAQRAVVLVRPDANTVVQNITLAAGTRQALPAGGLRLLGVARNMGANGNTPGKAIRFVDREALDDLDRDWHTATQESVVDELVYDEKKTPGVFYVSPPATASPAVTIEVSLSKTPTDVTDADSGAITLPDIYAGPMQSWMLYRAYGLATQAMNHFQRSQFHFTAFFNQLGVKIRAEMFMGAFTPGVFPAAGARNG